MAAAALAASPSRTSSASFTGRAEAIAAWTAIEEDEPLEQKQEKLRGFMEREGLDFPVVLKPDIGERGSGVAIIRDWEAGLRVSGKVPGHGYRPALCIRK